MNYREALAWLYGTQRLGIKLGLENAARLFAALEVAVVPPTMHVAGTNGKGSVCAIAESIFRAAGHRTGLFTSPHLVRYRERIQVSGAMVSEQQVAEELTRIHCLIAGWEPHPTFFEITTALALSVFKAANCEILVLETGLGGRLDATNAVTAAVSVLTPIAMDHQKWLGNTLEEIAFEKAGIIKPSVPVFSARQAAEAETVIRRVARDRSAPLTFVHPDRGKNAVALPGRHQVDNAALAVAALRALPVNVDAAAVARGLETVQWPGRFQREGERLVIDGAHNPSGAQALAATWRESFREAKATIIFAVLHDKDIHGIIKALAPIAARFVLPRIRSERAVSPHDLADEIASIAPSLHHSTTPSFAEALAQAEAFADPVLIAGSLHFVGEALAHLRGVEYEDCAQ